MKNFSNWRNWFRTMRGGNNPTRSGCCQPVKPPSTPLPPDPNLGKVQFIAPDTRGTERVDHEAQIFEGPQGSTK